MAGIVDLDSDPNRIQKDPKDENDEILLKNHMVALQTLTSLFNKVEINGANPFSQFEDTTVEKQEFHNNAVQDAGDVPFLNIDLVII